MFQCNATETPERSSLQTLNVISSTNTETVKHRNAKSEGTLTLNVPSCGGNGIPAEHTKLKPNSGQPLLLLHWLYQDVLSRRVRFPIKGENCPQQLTSIVHMDTTHQCNHVYAVAATACRSCMKCTSCTSCMPPMIGSIKYAVSGFTLGCQAKCIGVETLKVICKLGDLQTSQFKKVEVHHIPNTETSKHRGSKLGVARPPKTLQPPRLNKLKVHGSAIAKKLHI